VLQSFLEFRGNRASDIEPRGETGISRVELLSGEAFRQAEAAGRWSKDLVDLAMQAERNADMKRTTPPAVIPTVTPANSHALLLTYKDGTKASILKLGSTPDRWNIAWRTRGPRTRGPSATALYNGPWGNFNLFNALTHAIAHFFKTGKSPYPVERTLLVSGVLDVAMHSHHAGDKPIDTPHLEFGYPAQDFEPFCETGESWRVLTPAAPSPTTFNPKG
jgi:hypothetical protein